MSRIPASALGAPAGARSALAGPAGLLVRRTGVSSMRADAPAVMSGKAAVTEKTARGPYASTRKPEKYAEMMAPTAEDAQHRDCREPAVLRGRGGGAGCVEGCQRPDSRAAALRVLPWRSAVGSPVHLTGVPLARSTTSESTTTSEKAVLREPPTVQRRAIGSWVGPVERRSQALAPRNPHAMR